MANWASTSYRVEGSKNDLDMVCRAIDVAMADTEGGWEGKVVNALGATDRIVEGKYLRGFIVDYETEGKVLRIDADEAWGATDFRHVLAELLPQISIYFIVEEPGCEVYATNDRDGKYFPERYHLDANIGGTCTTDYFETEQQTYDAVSELLGVDNVTMDYLKDWNDKHKDDESYIAVHEYNLVV